MKTFTIIKVGFSTARYGLSDEYFTCVYTSTPRERKLYSGGLHSFSFKGLYGSEDRIAEVMEARGYRFSYCSNTCGQIGGENKKWPGFKSEKEAIEYIKGGFKND